MGVWRSLLAEVIMFGVISGLLGPDASDRGLARLHLRRSYLGTQVLMCTDPVPFLRDCRGHECYRGIGNRKAMVLEKANIL